MLWVVGSKPSASIWDECHVWDHLNSPSPTGTKLHQQTRKAIAKRTPALVAAIQRFNKYCATLQDLYNPEWSIPLPQPLPTTLRALREDPHLMEDVWITPSEGAIPRWLEDANVRRGIRAMLKRDRCQEELRRLKREAVNISRFFGRQLAAVESAIKDPASQCDPSRSLLASAHLTIDINKTRHCLLSWCNVAIGFSVANRVGATSLSPRNTSDSSSSGQQG